MVSGRRVAAARPRSRSPAVRDHRGRRENDPSRTRRVGSLSRRATDRPRPPARWWPTTRGKKTPLILSALEALVVPETAGDPMSTQKWVRSSLRTLSERLKEAGHALSPPTVSRLLRKL